MCGQLPSVDFVFITGINLFTKYWSPSISLNTSFCKGVLDIGVHAGLWEDRGEASGDVDVCFLLCLLAESNGKCLSAPLSRGHQVFCALSAPSLLLSCYDERCFEDPPSHTNTHPHVA